MMLQTQIYQNFKELNWKWVELMDIQASKQSSLSLFLKNIGKKRKRSFNMLEMIISRQIWRMREKDKV